MQNNNQSKLIKNQSFTGERPLFKVSCIDLQNCHFSDGESALKVSNSINVDNCTLASKYLFWHDDNLKIKNSRFLEGGRASIWYSSNILLEDSIVEAPKIFRDAKNITVHNSTIKNSNETLWDCQNVTIKNSHFEGDYLLLHSSDIEIENFTLDGNYSFQHVKNLSIKNANIKSKDAFWNTENVTVYDSVIEGEYLGWYSKNLKFINCKFIGTQPLCYIEDLVMQNCEMVETDLAFEYSSLHVEVTTSIDSVKNPKKGIINAKEIKHLILDDEYVELKNLEINSPILKIDNSLED